MNDLGLVRMTGVRKSAMAHTYSRSLAMPSPCEAIPAEGCSHSKLFDIKGNAELALGQYFADVVEAGEVVPTKEQHDIHHLDTVPGRPGAG